MKKFADLVEAVTLNEGKTWSIDDDHNDFKEGDTIVYNKKKYEIVGLMGDNEYFRVHDKKKDDYYTLNVYVAQEGGKGLDNKNVA